MRELRRDVARIAKARRGMTDKRVGVMKQLLGPDWEDSPDNPYYLIEYREGGQTTGYLQRGSGGWSFILTPESSEAGRFQRRSEAWALIESADFQEYMPHPERFTVEGHRDCSGPLPLDEAQLSP